MRESTSYIMEPLDKEEDGDTDTFGTDREDC